MADGLRLAIGTLSVLPAPAPRRVDREVAGRAMLLAPAVGLLLGGIAAAVVATVHALRPEAPLLAGVLGVVTLVLLSGALHLDGLADTADGLGSRRDRETMLRIMKKGDIGPFGVAAIAGILLLDVAALTACVSAGIGWQALVIATTAGRLTLPWCCRRGVPAAQPEGLGAMVASTVRPVAAILGTVAVVAVGIGLLLVTGPDTGTVRALIGAGAAPLVAVMIGFAVVRRARTAFGGITGDVLGAAVELGLAGALLTLALALPGPAA